MTACITGAKAAISQLVAESVEVVFGIPGAHNVHLCDAILDQPRLRFIGGRHEQDMAFMANGYARATGRLATSLVISGPGLTNSLTALADAYADSVPMLLLAAAPEEQAVGKGAFHELKDQTGLIASVTKWNRRVTRAKEVPATIREAVSQAYAGRPGPTAVEIPCDVQGQEGQAQILAPASTVCHGADRNAAADAARILIQAKRPLVCLGSGAIGCAAEAIGLIERLRAPCCATALGLGIVPADHPLNLGYVWMRHNVPWPIFEEADAVLVVGCELTETETGGWTLPLPRNLIQVDTCPEVIGRGYPVSVGLTGEPRIVLAELNEFLGHADLRSRPSPVDRVAQLKRNIQDQARQSIMWGFVDAMTRALPRDAFVTNDASLANGWILSHVPRYLPRTINITSNFAALGYALPAAIGAKIAYPDRQAVAVAGDGGFLFTTSALATAVQFGLNAVAVVFDDQCYNTIKRIQKQKFDRTIGVDLRSPDFVGLAEAHGAVGVRAEQPGVLHEALTAAWRADIPTVIHVPLDEAID